MKQVAETRHLIRVPNFSASIHPHRIWKGTQGVIHKEDRNRYFYLPLNTRSVVLPSVEDGQYILLHGPQGSAKSTALEELKDMLKGEKDQDVCRKDYRCITASLREVSLKDKTSFWSSLSVALQKDNPRYRLSKATDELGFLFDVFTKEAFGEKTRVVLLLDDVDTIRAAPTIINSFFSILIGLRDRRHRHALHSVVMTGTYDLITTMYKSEQPFNPGHPIQMPFVDKEDFLATFDEFNFERRNAIDKRIPIDLFGRTNGQAGFTSFCCKVLDEKVLGDRKDSVSYDEWLEYATLKLPSQILSSYQPIRRTVKKLTEEGVRHLADCFLVMRKPLQLQSWKEEKLAESLAGQGALVLGPSDPDYTWSSDGFVVSSPLLRSILLDHVASKNHEKEDVKAPLISFLRKGPASKKKELDIPLILQHVLTHFKPSEAFYFNLTDNRTEGRLPPEICYLAEFRKALGSLLPSWIKVKSEINLQKSASNLRFVLVIDAADHRYVLELVSNVMDKDALHRHIARLKHCKELVKAKECWLVNCIRSSLKPNIPTEQDLEDKSVQVFTHKGW